MPIMLDNDGLRFPSISAAMIVSCFGGAITGWVNTRVFTSLNPVAGALYGAAELLSSALLVTPILNELFKSSEAEKVAKFILNFFVSSAFAYGIVILVGLKITFEASLALSLLMIPTYIVTMFVLKQLGSLLD